MKSHTNMIATTLTIALIVGLALAAALAQAADTIVTGKIETVTVATDKNGNEYVRIIIPEKRSLNGIEYEAGVAIMAFSELANQAKALKPGDQLKAICASRDYQGRKSYTVLAFVK